MYVYLQPGRTLQGVVCKLAALRGGGQQPCPPTYNGGGRQLSRRQRGPLCHDRPAALPRDPFPPTAAQRPPTMATAAAGALRAAALQRFTLFRPMPHLRQRHRPWPRATRQRFPRTTSGRAPATIASRNITWRAPTSCGARPCPELMQGGWLQGSSLLEH